MSVLQTTTVCWYARMNIHVMSVLQTTTVSWYAKMNIHVMSVLQTTTVCWYPKMIIRVLSVLQLAHGYVLAGFNFKLDKDNNFLVKTKPTMVFQGVNATTVRRNRADRNMLYILGC